ncbi:MAG: hypothetical protein LIP08_13310 [Bacteroides sp.]|nr:hypothetical protein [Bacteroides sp.]
MKRGVYVTTPSRFVTGKALTSLGVIDFVDRWFTLKPFRLSEKIGVDQRKSQ